MTAPEKTVMALIDCSIALYDLAADKLFMTQDDNLISFKPSSEIWDSFTDYMLLVAQSSYT